MIRRILHASDFSSASRPAFAKAVELAKGNRAELIVTHVLALTMPLTIDGYISPKVYADIEATARREARKRLEALVVKAKRAGVRARALLLEGIPADRIVRAARSQRADLVVIGTHGRTGFSRLVLGSVASRVISQARCAVLTVRGR
jgi:nucleotide-binding universal stress UspA family protein